MIKADLAPNRGARDRMAIMSGGQGPDITQGSNKFIALMIAILALALAFSEALGNNAKTESLAANVEASNLWAFFQAKTIRRTTIQGFAEEMEVMLLTVADPTAKEAMKKQIDRWKAMAERYESDPKENNGRKELFARAKEQEKKRDLNHAKDEWFEFSSAAFQIAIVLASAVIITGVAALIWLVGGFGIAGLILMGIGLFAPLSLVI